MSLICLGLFSWVNAVRSCVTPFNVQEKVAILCQPLQYYQPLCQFLLDCSIKPISYDQFRVVDVGFIMALLQRICSCRHQNIIRDSYLETTLVPKNLHSSMAGLFALDYGFTSLTLSRRILLVFNFKSFIHTRWDVLGHLANHCHHWWFSLHLLMIYIIDR